MSLSDFWLYLRGRDGVDGEGGQKLALSDTAYLDRVDPGLYNVAPVIAIGKKTDNGEELEYVNPISGGAAFIVTGPGPVIIPNCEVTFTSMDGSKTYTKTSDEQGYIYLTRAELPEWADGSPSAKDDPDNIATGVRPTSFSFGSTTVSEASKIAATCKVPYRVGLKVVTQGARLNWYMTCPYYYVYRVVEGMTEEIPFINYVGKFSGSGFPTASQGCYPRVNSSVFSYYRNKGVSVLLSRISGTLGSETSSLSDDELTVWFSNLNHICGSRSSDYLLYDQAEIWYRSKNGNASYYSVGYGNGANPDKIGVYDLMTSNINGSIVSGGKQGSLVPDYGLKVEDTEREVMNPPYYSMPDEVDGTYTWDSGHTNLNFGLSASAMRELSSTIIYRYGDWDDNNRYVFEEMTFGDVYRTASIKLTGEGKSPNSSTTVKIDKSFDIFNGFDVDDIYNGFKLTIGDFVDGSIMVAGFSGSFSTNLPDAINTDDERTGTSLFGCSMSVIVQNVTGSGN